MMFDSLTFQFSPIDSTVSIKMELRLNLQILFICLTNYVSSLASDVVGADLWGIEQCRDAGFSSANLLCASCKGEAFMIV